MSDITARVRFITSASGYPLTSKKGKPQVLGGVRIIPRWLMALVAILYLLALVDRHTVNLAQRANPDGNEMFPWELRTIRRWHR